MTTLAYPPSGSAFVAHCGPCGGQTGIAVVDVWPLAITLETALEWINAGRRVRLMSAEQVEAGELCGCKRDGEEGSA